MVLGFRLGASDDPLRLFENFGGNVSVIVALVRLVKPCCQLAFGTPFAKLNVWFVFLRRVAEKPTITYSKALASR